MQIRLFLSLLLLCVLFWRDTGSGMAQAALDKTDTPPVKILRRVPLFSHVHNRETDKPADTSEHVNRIFLDRKRHRLLVQVRRYKERIGSAQSLFWVEQDKVRPCTEWAYMPPTHYPGDPELIAANMETGVLYYITSNGEYLYGIDRRGDQVLYTENPDHLLSMTFGKKPGRSYRGFNKWNTDVAEGGG